MIPLPPCILHLESCTHAGFKIQDSEGQRIMRDRPQYKTIALRFENMGLPQKL